jgi:hypothetical protein
MWQQCSLKFGRCGTGVAHSEVNLSGADGKLFKRVD